LKRLLSIALLAIALVTFAFNRPALAADADAASGAKVFSANCSTCHPGGINVVMSQKNFKERRFREKWDEFA
jgi:cytochrome c6